MPRFELEQVGPELYSGVVRARDAEDAVRRGAAVDRSTEVAIGEEDALEGWREVTIGNTQSGRVRVHDRMRFRRA